MKRCIITSSLFVLLAAMARAQEIPPASELSAGSLPDSMRFNTITTGVERNLNTFNWVGRARIDTVAWGTIVKVTEQYTSNTILLDGSTPATRHLQSDQQNLSLSLGRPLATNLTSEVQWKSLVYSDNKSVGLGQAKFHSVLGGVEYVPLEFIVLSPLLGYRWDTQAGVRDRGLSYTMAAQTRDIDVDGYQFSGVGQFHEDRLNPRLLQRHLARVGAQRYFDGRTRDSLEFGYSRNRNEFYTIADGNIESRSEDIFSFANLLDYEFDDHFLTSIFVGISNRSLDKDIRHFSGVPDPTLRINTTIQESRFETFVQGTYRSNGGGTTLSIRLGHAERDEQHSAQPIPGASPEVEAEVNRRDRDERTKDNLARRTSLTGVLRLPLSFSDTVFFSGATSILRYDTPSDLSRDIRVDRDELLVALSLATTHRLSQHLDLGISLTGNLSHVVYLFGKWSGNNNYNRVLRLSPATTYRPSRSIVSTNGFEVLANYTVYDYEEQVSGVRSFSYRQFGWMDSSSVEFTKRIGLDFFSYLKLYERGQLRWVDFSERIENSFVDKTIFSQIRFIPEAGLLFALGLRYFSQSRYSYDTGTKVLDLFIRSFGPTCLVLWDIGPRSTFQLKGWYERRTFSTSQGQQAATSQSFPNLSMSITIHL